MIRLALCFSQSQPHLGSASSSDRSVEKAGQHSTEIKTTIKTILGFAQITVRVLLKVKGVIRSSDRSLEVAQHGVDAGKTGHLGAFSLCSNNLRFMDATYFRHSPKATQSIRDLRCRGLQPATCPRGDLLAAEGPHGVKNGNYRVPLVIGFHSGHKGYFVFRTATGFTTWVLAPKVRIVNFDPTTLDCALFSFAHDLEQLVFDSPSGAVADSDEALQLQGGDVILGLGQEVHSLEPLNKGQSAGMKDGPSSESNLRMAAVTLEGLDLAMPHDAVAAPLA